MKKVRERIERCQTRQTPSPGVANNIESRGDMGQNLKFNSTSPTARFISGVLQHTDGSSIFIRRRLPLSACLNWIR